MLFENAQKCADRGLVEMGSRLLHQDADRRVSQVRLAVRPVGGQHVKGIGNGDDARLERDLIASKGARIAAPVHPLTLRMDDGGFLAERAEPREDLDTKPRMLHRWLR